MPAVDKQAPLQAVIFDFGNVLCFPPHPEKIARAAQSCGLVEAQFLDAFWTRRLEYDGGLLEPAEYWKTIADATGTQFGDALLPALVAHEIEFWNHYDQRLFDWIDQLRKADIRTGILSNLPRVLGEVLRSTPGFLDHFDHVTFSYELKIVKPDAAIYRHMIEGLGIAPRQALFLDDKQPNVDGAHAVGLQAELFTTWDDFVKQDIAGRYGLPRPS